MATNSSVTFIICIFVASWVFFVSSAQNCSDYTFPGKKVFKSCVQLPVLNASLHWNYFRRTRTVHIAYRAVQSPDGWIAWAINPNSEGMVGSQALVAFRDSNGTMKAFTTQITSYSPSMQPGALSFPVAKNSATYEYNEMTIFAVIGPLGNITTVNHAWQAGPLSSNTPRMHSMSGPNVESFGTLDFLS